MSELQYTREPALVTGIIHCACVCVYACDLCVYVHSYVCVCVRVHVCVCECVRVYVCMRVCSVYVKLDLENRWTLD